MFLLLSKFHHLPIKKESSVTHTKVYCEKKVPKSPEFEGNFSEICHIRLDRFQQVAKI
jgi:hypothetical protein